ncbi:AEC family transporter [Oceanisphaera arctica]|uniref:Transporter n=1 Tax=Oceanisphaera arctica TaxID=641510 RepID=A0A2P5TJ85_9GAMM|nr:AEC family transporter [Oceanisphaera arctica]PPL14902.1 hypothetical protein UN63_14400 [Oceanisphaera arctica]GHA29641.1 transporter [Oceanisphaera arctica]
MTSILSIMVPIFLLIALGYVAVSRQLLTPQASQGLGQFVLYFAMPALLFQNLSQMKFEQVLDPLYLIAYAGGSLLTLVTALLLIRCFRHKDGSLAAIQVMGMTAPNSAFFGYPILLQVLETSSAKAFAMSVMVENLIIIPLGLLLLEYNTPREGQPRTGSLCWLLLRRLLRNPLLLAIMAGLCVSLLSIRLPEAISLPLGLLGQASVAVALFAIGGSLVGNRIQSNLPDMGMVMVGKLILHPLLAALMIWLLPPFDPGLSKALVLIAAMPMMSMYPIIGAQFGHGRFCAGTLLLTTMTAFITISMALWLLQT